MRVFPELVVVDDGSRDRTWASQGSNRFPDARADAKRRRGHGFGRAIVWGLDHSRGDAVVIMMADASDSPSDAVRYWHLLNAGNDCAFGSRFVAGGEVIDYPRVKLFVNRLANFLVRIGFNIPLNDTTNAFKAYRRTVLDGCRPFLARHFNLTVELPLKAIVRGYSFAIAHLCNNRSSASPN